MPKTVRYCIQCGLEIGEAMTCPNPDCGGIPNFYRTVPGPDRRSDPRRQRAPTAPARAGAPRDGASGDIPDLDPAESPPPSHAPVRQTLDLAPAPVAVLRSVSKPSEEHPLRPGTTEVGAGGAAELLIDRPAVSGRHARIDLRRGAGGAWEVEVTDHGSTNGTFVNGKRVSSARLKAGDAVRFADAEYKLLFVADEKPRVTIELD
jgi:hypothetical protein